MDLGTGNASVSFATDQGTEGIAAIEKDLEVGMSDPGELIDEGLEGGITNLEQFLRTKKKDGGEVSLTVIEIPDISESGVESLFKRR